MTAHLITSIFSFLSRLGFFVSLITTRYNDGTMSNYEVWSATGQARQQSVRLPGVLPTTSFHAPPPPSVSSPRPTSSTLVYPWSLRPIRSFPDSNITTTHLLSRLHSFMFTLSPPRSFESSPPGNDSDLTPTSIRLARFNNRRISFFLSRGCHASSPMELCPVFFLLY
ncbi:hypothetical protein BOTBODRAFT_439173 [Botryobasidium botryosum FD-172 SS1]|uniref:Uncharacterized protein n=1 Tax=Botryobasidium botryosum (strain FD-172 SS1) TaxID=930990 RepID=A0A067N5N1_BOTB1|nr:hypothetical protein BOTBODRAFT_439173 [Botryobasidium botryosum FD-172 SS1]